MRQTQKLGGKKAVHFIAIPAMDLLYQLVAATIPTRLQPTSAPPLQWRQRTQVAPVRLAHITVCAPLRLHETIRRLCGDPSPAGPVFVQRQSTISKDYTYTLAIY